MSGPPVKKFNDAPTSVADESERQFRYFTPAKRRASLYEDVTCDTQPSVHRHLNRGWPLYFEDGRGMWNDESTALRCKDWFAFRDPAGLWERPFYQSGARSEAQIDGAVAGAIRDGLFADFDPQWVEFLRDNVQAPAFAEHGLWLATASVGRDCLSDSVTHAVVLEAAYKQRMAQSIVLYAMDLEPQFGDFSTSVAKQRWMEHEAWQPTRALVERLHATNDWGEVVFATNVCFEPIVGTMMRRELGMRAATANGDTVTPVISRAGQTEWGWTADWTAQLMNLVLSDETHGTSNREVVAGWLESWLPDATKAAEALTGLLDEMPVSFSADDARARVLESAAEFHETFQVGDLVKASAA